MNNIKPGDLCKIITTDQINYDTWFGYTKCEINKLYRTPMRIDNILCIFLGKQFEKYDFSNQMFVIFSPQYGIIYLSSLYHKLIEYDVAPE